MMNKAEKNINSHAVIMEKVEAVFTAYLEKLKLRKTQERYSILREVYEINDHFDIESLFVQMKNKNYQISRATVYNTIDHLLACDLVTKHQFGKNLALFERSFAYKQHDHLICLDCDKVLEFCDPRIEQIQTMMGQILDFQVVQHSLNLFGKCKKLANNGFCEHQTKKNKITLSAK